MDKEKSDVNEILKRTEFLMVKPLNPL